MRATLQCLYANFPVRRELAGDRTGVYSFPRPIRGAWTKKSAWLRGWDIEGGWQQSMPVALCGWCRPTVFVPGLSPIFPASYLDLIKFASSHSASDALWPKAIRGKLCHNCNKAAEFSDPNFT